MKNLIKLTTTLLLFCVGFVSCNDENEETSMNNELIGWYINKTGIPNSNEFLPIEAAIKNNELLYSSKYAGDCYATRELFFYSDGSFGRHDYTTGRLGKYIKERNWELSKTAIRIIDETTLIRYGGGLYDKNMVDNNYLVSFYRLYAGEIFGYLDYMGIESLYTYVKMDNKIVLSNGDIYTIVEGGLIKEGLNLSSKMEKYDLTKTY